MNNTNFFLTFVAMQQTSAPLIYDLNAQAAVKSPLK